MLRSKVALITGAGSGIGKAAALKFAGMGCRLVLADLDEPGLRASADEVNSQGGNALAMEVDVSRSADVQDMMQKGLSGFGRLDFAVNNAGIYDGGLLHEASEEQFDRLVSVNLKGVFLCMKYEIPIILENKESPAIVNIASVAALRGLSATGVYCASKAGVVALTQTAAVESQGRIRVNCICPGSVQTPMVTKLLIGQGMPVPKAYESVPGVCPAGRFGQPEEVAEAIY